MDYLNRVRHICQQYPETTERLSHGEPTFFVRSKVFAMFANNHHNDGRIAVWLAAPPGMQSALIEAEPETFFKPPYVGVRGWIGIELANINDDDLAFHIHTSWQIIAPKNLRQQFEQSTPPQEPAD